MKRFFYSTLGPRQQNPRWFTINSQPLFVREQGELQIPLFELEKRMKAIIDGCPGLTSPDGLANETVAQAWYSCRS